MFLFGYVKRKRLIYYKLQSAHAIPLLMVYICCFFKQLKLLNDTADKSWVVVVRLHVMLCFFHGSMNGFNVSPFKWPFHISKPLVSFKFRITHLIYGYDGDESITFADAACCILLYMLYSFKRN